MSGKGIARNGKGFSERLERILTRDSKALFVKLVQDHPAEITLSLVEKCAKFGAKKCLLALLNGELGVTPPALDAHLPDTDTGVTPLAYVTYSCLDPQIIDLMLHRYNAIPLVNVSCTIAVLDGLPLHHTLIHLSYVDHLYPWARGSSLIKLVILLCQWNTKPILDSARLLAQYTNSINDIAWTFIKYGGLKQFGALLLVAREKVMAPFDTGLTIRQYLSSEIDSFSEYDVGSDEYEYKNHLIDAKKLIDVFERAGDSLSLYCSSMQKHVAVEKVVADVSNLLKKAGVRTVLCDFKLRRFFLGRRALSRIKPMKLAGPFGYSSDSSYISALPAGEGYRYLFRGYRGIEPIRVPNLVHSVSQPRSVSTAACRVMKISKPFEHAHVNPFLKNLAYMTVKLKKGLRFL